MTDIDSKDQQQPCDEPSSPAEVTRECPVGGPWKKCLIILGLTFIAYSSSFSNGYIWDDNDYVTENPTLRSFNGLKAIWLEPSKTPQYYPLVHTSYWVEYQLWGLNPAGYHVVNTLLHGIAACLLYLVLMRLKLPGAWVAAAIFAVHPVTVESVAWITERKNVLSVVFFFLSLLAFMKAVRWSDESLERPAVGEYAIALCFFICALLSKTVTCSLPAVIVVLIWWQRRSFTRKDWMVIGSLIPFFVIGLLMALVTVQLEKQQVGAQGMEWDFSALDRCLIAGRSLIFYMQKLMYPHPLIFFYERWEINSAVWWQYLFPAGFAVLLVGTVVMRRRWGRGIPAGLMIFAGTLVPALGFFNVYPHRYSFVADHFQYLAMPAFIALVVGLATSGLKTAYNDTPPRALKFALCAVVLLLFMVQTFIRCSAYKDERTLWVDTLEKNDRCWAAYNNLGLILFDEGNFEEAETCFRKTIQFKPDHAKAYSHLGWLYDEKGLDGEAEAMLKKAIELRPNIPNFRVLLGNFYAKRKRYSEAMENFRTVLSVKQPHTIRREFFLAAVGAGNIFMELEQFGKGEMLYSKAIEHQPNTFPPLLYRARARIKLDKLAEARGDFDRLTILLQPGNALQKRQLDALSEALTQAEASKDTPE